jgi:hypothetical protein
MNGWRERVADRKCSPCRAPGVVMRRARPQAGVKRPSAGCRGDRRRALSGLAQPVEMPGRRASSAAVAGVERRVSGKRAPQWRVSSGGRRALSGLVAGVERPRGGCLAASRRVSGGLVAGVERIGGGPATLDSGPVDRRRPGARLHSRRR